MRNTWGLPDRFDLLLLQQDDEFFWALPQSPGTKSVSNLRILGECVTVALSAQTLCPRRHALLHVHEHPNIMRHEFDGFFLLDKYSFEIVRHAIKQYLRSFKSVSSLALFQISSIIRAIFRPLGPPNAKA